VHSFRDSLVPALLTVLGLVSLAGMVPTPAVASASEPDPCPADYPYGQPTAANLVYKTFASRPSGQTVRIRVDEYNPPRPSGPASAVVLAHGGGWFRGCKSLLNEEAVAFAGDGFIVFAIDYRLACTDADHPTPEEAPLCGWTYPMIDPATGTSGAAVHDVQDAVAWVRANAGGFFPFTGRVAVVGGSAGGTLGFTASRNLPSGDPHRPDAVAGWSALTEFGRTSEGTYTCDGAGGEPGAVGSCWTAVVKYMGCDVRTSPDPACAAAYQAGSPAIGVSSSAPPGFIANADRELVDLQDALDLQLAYQSHLVSTELCVIQNSSLHGRAYLFTKPCNSDPPPPAGPTVFDQTELFV
jgi:acetyl esterase/lipase